VSPDSASRNPTSRDQSLCPARLDPVFVPRIWGAPSLAPLFPDAKPGELPIGEVWLTGDASRFADGPFAGQTLADAWHAMPPAWSGTQLDTRAAFPILAKFLFPAEKLSVQVHPDDEYARAHEAAAGGVGKTEMWFCVDAKPGAAVCVGLRPGVTQESFRRAIADNSVETLLVRYPVSKGEGIFVPARTAHTIGPGLVLCEIQQNSDVTYRVYDYNRRQPDGKTRPLHIEKALEVIAFDNQRGGILHPARVPAHGDEIAHFIACKYFAVEKWEFSVPLKLRTEPEHFDLWIVISGRGKFTWKSEVMADNQSAEYSPGQAWFVPATMSEYQFEPAAQTIMLHVYVPDLDRYAAQLAGYGITPGRIAQVVRR
jgi:mannose-6-phosphate isomerase